jgi:hypothetical protein
MYVGVNYFFLEERGGGKQTSGDEAETSLRLLYPVNTALNVYSCELLAYVLE